MDTTDLSGGCVGQVSIIEVRCRGGGQRGCQGHTWHLSFDGEKRKGPRGLSVHRPQAGLMRTHSFEDPVGVLLLQKTQILNKLQFLWCC